MGLERVFNESSKKNYRYIVTTSGRRQLSKLDNRWSNFYILDEAAIPT